MVKFNQLYYKFNIYNGREEFHMSSVEEEVRTNNALSSSIPVGSFGHLTWKKKCLGDVKLFKMKLVRDK